MSQLVDSIASQCCETELILAGTGKVHDDRVVQILR